MIIVVHHHPSTIDIRCIPGLFSLRVSYQSSLFTGIMGKKTHKCPNDLSIAKLRNNAWCSYENGSCLEHKNPALLSSPSHKSCPHRGKWILHNQNFHILVFSVVFLESNYIAETETISWVFFFPYRVTPSLWKFGSLVHLSARRVKMRCWLRKLLVSMTRWWFQIFFIFTPTWGNDPIWRNHQLDDLFVSSCRLSTLLGLAGLATTSVIWFDPKKTLTVRYGCQPKNRVFYPPNHPFVHRVFHYFHHPFGGTPIFGNIHMVFGIGIIPCGGSRCMRHWEMFIIHILQRRRT